MKSIFIIILIFISSFSCFPQDSIAVFYYPDGKIASKGPIVKGKPDGYWITYHENGKIKSEGNRKNYLLEGTWKFYDDNEILKLSIDYKEDKKHGKRITYLDNQILEEQYEENLKNGLTILYDTLKQKLEQTPFRNGKEQGLGKIFSKDGRIIEIIEYKEGYIVARENINRLDKNNMKQGKWKWFYNNDILKQEGNYVNNKKHGFFKYYDTDGNLINIERYHYDDLLKGAAETAQYEIRRAYYKSGTLKIEAAYLNNQLEGTTRFFDSLSGKITVSYWYENGKLMGEGLIDENGFKQGEWKEYYKSGKLKALGFYKNGFRFGYWKYFYEDGNLEQEGLYIDNELPHQSWKWYYNNGKPLRIENYKNGILEGNFIEYDDSSNIVTKGEYYEGEQDGFWFLNYGDFKFEGNYAQGALTGEWKAFYDDGQLYFKGAYIDDNPDGKHIYYWPNGLVKLEGNYNGYVKNGNWNYYSETGELILIITYSNGKEIKYDNIEIN